MRYRNLNYSFYAGTAVSLIGMMGVIGHGLDNHFLKSFLVDPGQEVALSTALAFVSLGIGVILSLGFAPELVKANSWRKLIPALLLFPLGIALYNVFFYFYVAQFQLLQPLVQYFT